MGLYCTYFMYYSTQSPENDIRILKEEGEYDNMRTTILEDGHVLHIDLFPYHKGHIPFTLLQKLGADQIFENADNSWWYELIMAGRRRVKKTTIEYYD